LLSISKQLNKLCSIFQKIYKLIPKKMEQVTYYKEYMTITQIFALIFTLQLCRKSANFGQSELTNFTENGIVNDQIFKVQTIISSSQRYSKHI